MKELAPTGVRRRLERSGWSFRSGGRRSGKLRAETKGPIHCEEGRLGLGADAGQVPDLGLSSSQRQGHGGHASHPRHFGDELQGVGFSHGKFRRDLCAVEKSTDASVVRHLGREQFAPGQRRLHVRVDDTNRRAKIPQVRNGQPVGLQRRWSAGELRGPGGGRADQASFSMPMAPAHAATGNKIVIRSLIDQYLCAQSRIPMAMMRHG